jgi:hypothetical protein
MQTGIDNLSLKLNCLSQKNTLSTVIAWEILIPPSKVPRQISIAIIGAAQIYN